MAEDLKRQASEMYRQRDEPGNIRTSEGLSIKKIAYISLAIVVLVLVVVQIFGGFKRRTDPVVAASTPPPLVKEAPPADLLRDEPMGRSEAAQPAPDQAVQIPAPPEQQGPLRPSVSDAPSPVPPAPPPPRTGRNQQDAKQVKPVLKRETADEPASRPPSEGRPTATESAEAKPAADPAPPAISDLERTRRELARSIVLEKNASLLELIASPDSRGWEAEPIGPEEYAVTFTILDKASGAALQYVWKVSLSSRTATPLSYYARKLS